MKHLSIAVLIFMASFSISYAQISLMPKVGVTFSDVKFEDDATNDLVKARTGFLVGTGVNFKVSDLFSIQPEFLYIQKGYKQSFLLGEGDFRLDYFEIPLLAKFSVGDDNKRGYLNLGPQISIGLGGKYKSESALLGNTEGKIKFGDEPINNVDAIYFDNRIDFGIQAGGGFGVKVGPGLITADFRLILGLGDLYDGGKSKNTTFCTNLAYFIPLGE